jgi:hypothetical protein
MGLVMHPQTRHANPFLLIMTVPCALAPARIIYVDDDAAAANVMEHVARRIITCGGKWEIPVHTEYD